MTIYYVATLIDHKIRKIIVAYFSHHKFLERPMRGKSNPEDKMPGIVLSRLIRELDLTLVQVCQDVGLKYSTLNGNSHGAVIGFPSTIKKLSEYFREVHGLSYVTGDYFLTGNEEDQKKLANLKKQKEMEEILTEPPFLKMASGE